MRSNEITSLEREFHLDRYWEILKSRRHILIICTALALVIGLVQAFTAVSRYEAQGTIMIEEEQEGQIEFNERMAFARRNSDYFRTQVRILYSRSLARKVLEELSASTFHQDEGDSSVSDSLGGSYAMHHRVNRFLSSLDVNPISNTQLVNVSFKSRSPERAAASVNTLFAKFITFNRELKTQSTRQTSLFINQQIKSLEQRLAQKEQELQRYSKEKDLFYLSNEENVEVDKFSDLNRAFTEAQVDRINKESLFRELESKSFEDYPAVRGNLLISTLKGNYSNLEADYKQKSQVFKESYPEMTRLKTQMEVLLERIKTETKAIAEQNLQEARTQYESALKKEHSLKRFLGKQKKEIVDTESNAIHYKSLSIEVENMRNLLNFLDRKQRETILASGDREGSHMSNIRIIDPAEVPQVRFSPKRKTIILMALVFGLGIGLILIFLLEFLDNSVKRTDDVRTLLGVPALGIVPSTLSTISHDQYDYSYSDISEEADEKDKPGHRYGGDSEYAVELINHNDPASPLAECYRNIRTALLMSTTANPPQVIAFSSSRPEEGKTATAVNMAVAFQQMGKKVLLIDGDLRKPRIHNIFKMDNTTGLSTYLQKGGSLKKAVFKTDIPNLDVLPAGPITQSHLGPLELLNSDKMAQLLKEEVRAHYDYVFIDSPPFVDIADPLVLGKLADGVVLVVWSGKTNRNWVEDVALQAGHYDIPLLGVVLNKVKQTGVGLGELKQESKLGVKTGIRFLKDLITESKKEFKNSEQKNYDDDNKIL